MNRQNRNPGCPSCLWLPEPALFVFRRVVDRPLQVLISPGISFSPLLGEFLGQRLFFCASRSSTLPGSADPVVSLPPPFFPRVIRQISAPFVPSFPESSVSSPFSSRIVVVPPPVSVTTPHSCERDVLDGTMVTLRAVTFCRNEGATVATDLTGGSPSGSVPVSSPVGVGVRSTPVSSEVGVGVSVGVGVLVGSGVGVGVSVGSGVNVKVGGHYQLWALA